MAAAAPAPRNDQLRDPAAIRIGYGLHQIEGHGPWHVTCFAEQVPWLRAYIPNAMYGDQPQPTSPAPERGPKEPPPLPASTLRRTVLGLALVALQDLADEELLLNYR